MTQPRHPLELAHDEVVDMAPSFVLGALDDAEMDAVRAHLATCPESHAEVTEFGEMLPVLQAGVPLIEPPPSLKVRLMAAAAADVDDRVATLAHTAPDVSSPPMTIAWPRRRMSWVLGLAAALAIVMLAGWNVLLQAQLDSARVHERQVASVLDAAGRPGALTAVMAPAAADGPSGIAAVTPDGRMRIAMRDLPPTAGTEVYEAWMIAGDKAPVALGGFQVGPNGVGYFEADGLPPDSGVVIALTREPRAGMTAPSSDPVSLGTATAPSST